MATIDDFAQLDIRVGEVVDAQPFPEARKPAYRMWVDFGGEVGVLQSSAQITQLYQAADLVGRQVLGVVNLPPRRIAGFSSQALVLGVYTREGVALIQPDRTVEKGDRLG